MLKINADELPRFMACHGSRLMGGEIPPLSADSLKTRDEGIAAHYMAVQIFKGTSAANLIDKKAPNGVFMTTDMHDYVDQYLNVLGSGKASRFIGMEVDTSHGENDKYFVAARTDFAERTFNNILRIVDFKYGYRIVEPKNNWTLILHAIGFIGKNPGFIPDLISFEIFQPRPYHPDGPHRKVIVSYDDLTALYMQLREALINPTDQLRTSAHCGKCPGLTKCPAARLAEMNAIDAAETFFEDKISDELLSFNLDTLYRAEQMIKQRREAFEELALHRIGEGKVIKDYFITNGLSNSRWIEGINPEIAMILTGVDLAKPAMVVPAEAKRRGVPKHVVAAMSYRAPTGKKLERAKANDKAERIFGHGSKHVSPNT